MRKTDTCDHDRQALADVFECEVHPTAVSVMTCLDCSGYAIYYPLYQTESCLLCAMAPRVGRALIELMDTEFSVEDLHAYAMHRRTHPRQMAADKHDARRFRELQVSRAVDDALGDVVAAIRPALSAAVGSREN